MRYILIFLLFITSCTSTNRVFICGDHECVNKDEANLFFEQNLSIEVKIIQKEKNNADKLNRLESVKIPKDFDYKKLKSISAEALEKLNKIKPETISQASRISGVSPNDISVLLVYMGR